MLRRSIALLILSVASAACAAPIASPMPTASPSTSTAPPDSGGSSIVLQRVTGDLGCDTIGVDYTSLTFHIDPGATEQVIALTNRAVTLKTYWSMGFQPGSDAERVIRDGAGKVVVSDGDPLLVPAASYPRLAGYFVCLAPDAIYVFSQDPT